MGRYQKVAAGATASYAEAMEVLETERSSELEIGRLIARRQIARRGETTGPAVYAEMLRKGLVDRDEKAHWLGPLFRHQDFIWTGRYADGTELRAHSKRTDIKVWTSL